jgi:hypothetical protein
MADLIKQLRRAIKHTEESYVDAWKKRGVIRGKAAAEQSRIGRRENPKRTFGVTDSPVLTVDEAKLFLDADSNIQEAHRLYGRLSELVAIPGQFTKREIDMLEALGKKLVSIEDKWARGRAIPTIETSGFRKAPAMRGERGVLEAANSVIEDWEQAQPAQRIGDRQFVIMEDYDPGDGEEGKEGKAEGSRRHKRRRKRRRTQKKQGKKRRTQRRRKRERGKTRRRRRKR